MLPSWNIIAYIYEDDHEFISPFMMDLPHISKMSEYTDMSATIEYHSQMNIHGHYLITIRGGKISLKSIDPINAEEEKSIVTGMIELCKNYFRTDRRNIFLYGGHCYRQFIRPFRKNMSIEDWIEFLVKANITFDISVFDCCYTSEVKMLMNLSRVTKYYIGCQSASPYLGYFTADFVRILNSKASIPSMIKKWIHSFIDRNNVAPRKLTFHTDGVGIDLRKFNKISGNLNLDAIKPRRTARVEDGPEYKSLQDLQTLLKHNKMKNKIAGCIIHYQQSLRLQKRKKSVNMHGISIFIH